MSDFLTASEARAYVRCRSDKAFYQWLRRRREAGRTVTTYRRGNRLLFKQADLDAALTVERARKPRRQAFTAKPHDTTLPLNVRWLCRPCHRIADVDRHERERKPLRRVG